MHQPKRRPDREAEGEREVEGEDVDDEGEDSGLLPQSSATNGHRRRAVDGLRPSSHAVRRLWSRLGVGVVVAAVAVGVCVAALLSPLLSSAPPQRYPVCSAEGQALWAALSLSNDSLTGRAEAGRPHWASLHPLPPPSINPWQWSLPSSLNLNASEAASVAYAVCSHVSTLISWLYFQRPVPPSQHNIVPPFPFPSLQHSLPEVLHYMYPTKLVTTPNHNPSDASYFANGSKIPLDYASYTDDAELMRATWPDCFDQLEVRPEHSTDLRHFLQQLSGVDAAEQQRRMKDVDQLNSLALSLNLDLFPYSLYPNTDRYPSLPMIITTINTRWPRPTLVRMLRDMLGVEDSTLYFVFEDIDVDTLRYIAEHFTFSRVFLYFVPVQRCHQHSPYPGALNKDWRINFALLFSFHLVFNLLEYEYALVVEDDMEYGRDHYLFHLSLHEFAVRSPYVYAASSSSYSRFYSCYHARGHLQGNFSQPDIHDMAPHTDDTQTLIGQDMVLDANLTATHLLMLERLVVPWGAGYTRKFYAFLLGFYMGWWQSMLYERYDVIAQHVYGMHPYMHTLIPYSARTHGDPCCYHQRLRTMPLLTACQHTTWQVVSPREHRQTIYAPNMSRYDYIAEQHVDH